MLEKLLFSYITTEKLACKQTHHIAGVCDLFPTGSCGTTLATVYKLTSIHTCSSLMITNNMWIYPTLNGCHHTAGARKYWVSWSDDHRSHGRGLNICYGAIGVLRIVQWLLRRWRQWSCGKKHWCVPRGVFWGSLAPAPHPRIENPGALTTAKECKTALQTTEFAVGQAK